MDGDLYLVLGAALIIIGLAAIAAVQIFLGSWLKKYNKEWEEYENDVSEL